MSYERLVQRVPSLDPIEERLSDFIQGVNIIDELSISSELGSQLRRGFNYQLQRRVLPGLFRSYPTCFVVHLVAEGIYGYESGNYWGGTPLKKHGSQNDVQEGGQFFETFVETSGLETFPDRSHRYVSLILLHSSIPNDSLPRFFEYALYPAVHDPEWAHFTPRELVQRWPEESPTSYRLSNVVHTFFREGGEVAIDFVARCLEMARQTSEDHEVPSSQEVRLPERIVQAYAEWWEASRKERQSRSPQPEDRRNSANPPNIWLDPWQAQIMVDLPSQRLTVDREEDVDLQWRIQAESRSDVRDVQIDVHAFKTKTHWASEAESVPLPAPARSYHISLTGTVSPQSWSFDGLVPEKQLLIFDADTKEILPSPQALPARPLWLVYPKKADIRVAGGRVAEAESELRGHWESFVVSCWDLSSARSVTVDDTTWPVVSQGQGLRPRLLGGDELPLGENRDRYYSDLPEIRIPVAPNREVEKESAQWELRISELPGGSTTIPLTSLNPSMRSREQAIVLLLSHVIEDSGAYKVGVRGPMGRSATFSFRFLRDCSVRLPKKPRFPREDGSYPEGHVVLRTAPEDQIDSTRDDVVVESSDRGVHNITFGASCTQAEVRHLSEGSTAETSFPLKAPGLQWAIRAEDGLTSWSTRPIRRAVDEIEQSSKSELVVRSSPSLSGIDLDGELRVKSGKELLQSIESKSRASGQLRFDLLEVLDLLYDTDQSLQLELALADSRSAQVARVEASLHVKSIGLVARRSDGIWNLEVNWETEGKPVLNRCLRLWSVGRPWEAPQTFQIPDDARGKARLRCSIPDLPPGPYLASLNLEDPWEDNFPERPSEHDSNAARVEVGSAAERLKHSWEETASVETKLERAFLADRASEAGRHLNEASKLVSVRDTSLFLRALWWLGSSQSLVEQLAKRQNVVHRWMRNQVVDTPERLIAALNGKDFRWKRSDRLQSFLVALGLPQSIRPASAVSTHDRDMIWQVWPPLGWMMEVERLLAGDSGSLRRARRTTGVGELLIHKSDREDYSSELDEIEWRDLRSDNEMLGGQLQDQETSLPPQILRQQQHELNATLRGHFDDDKSWLAVNFDWLITLKNTSEFQTTEVSNLLRSREPLRAGIEKVLEKKVAPRAVVEGLLNRYDPRPEAELTNVPFCVGATALIQRAYAVHEISLPFAAPEDLLRCGAAAFDVAQRLYERDLCLSSIALAQHDAPDR